jgi:hypothetical protein
MTARRQLQQRLQCSLIQLYPTLSDNIPRNLIHEGNKVIDFSLFASSPQATTSSFLVVPKKIRLSLYANAKMLFVFSKHGEVQIVRASVFFLCELLQGFGCIDSVCIAVN